MAREIDWKDAEEIGIQLQEKHPELEPYSVRFTDLHKFVMELPGFIGEAQEVHGTYARSHPGGLERRV